MPTRVYDWRVPTLVGNTYRRDHQYFPTVTWTEWAALMTAAGIDNSVAVTLPGDTHSLLHHEDYFHTERTFNPMAQWSTPLSLDQIMALVWRVRDWDISGTWGGTATGWYYNYHMVGDNRVYEDDADSEQTATASSTIVTSTDSLDPHGFTSIARIENVLNERRLMRVGANSPNHPSEYAGDLRWPIYNDWINTPYMLTNATFADDSPDAIIPTGVNTHYPANIFAGYVIINIGQRVDRLYESIVYDNGFFYPWISIFGNLDFSHFNCYLELDGQINNGTITIRPEIAPDIVIPVSVRSYYSPVFNGLGPSGFVGGETTTSSSAYADIILTPHSFYGYRNRKGQVVYDRATGALKTIGSPPVNVKPFD